MQLAESFEQLVEAGAVRVPRRSCTLTVNRPPLAHLVTGVRVVRPAWLVESLVASHAALPGSGPGQRGLLDSDSSRTRQTRNEDARSLHLDHAGHVPTISSASASASASAAMRSSSRSDVLGGIVQAMCGRSSAARSWRVPRRGSTRPPLPLERSVDATSFVAELPTPLRCGSGRSQKPQSRKLGSVPALSAFAEPCPPWRFSSAWLSRNSG